MGDVMTAQEKQQSSSAHHQHQLGRSNNKASPKTRKIKSAATSTGVPLALSSSASSSSSSEDETTLSAAGKLMEQTNAPLVAGLISPQTICSQRALSIPISNGGVVVEHHRHHHADHNGEDNNGEDNNGAANADDGSESLPPQNSALLNDRLARAAPPHEHLYSSFKTTPTPMRSDAWAEPAASAFKVRGHDYFVPGGGGAANKIPSAPSVFELLAVDLVLAPKVIYSGLCAHPNERIQLALAREARTGVRQLPSFVFAVNLCLPAGPAASRNGVVVGPDACYHCVGYFGVDDKTLLTDTSTPEGKLTNQFFFGDSDEFRDNVFKLIPRIVEGNFVVRKAVGSKPSLLGTKLKLHYVRTDRYCEVLVDIASSSVAQTIVQLTLGYAKNLTVDMMFLFEGTDASTLPERILGGFRVCNIDFKRKDGQRIVE